MAETVDRLRDVDVPGRTDRLRVRLVTVRDGAVRGNVEARPRAGYFVGPNDEAVIALLIRAAVDSAPLTGPHYR